MDDKEILPGGIHITRLQSGFVWQLEALQRRVFPHLAESELLHAAQYLSHLEIFPEGQLVALAGDQVVGATTTMRYRLDPTQKHPSFVEIMGGGWLTTHTPEGEWLYGIDMSVDSAFRKRGIARALYRARQELCMQHHLKGQMTVGMLNGYFRYQREMPIEGYFEKVKRNEIFDPTVSVQLKIGFEIRGFAKDYLHDPTCGNSGAVLVLDGDKTV